MTGKGSICWSTALFDMHGRDVLVMGLGSHGGGAATAKYCVEHGARVTVTDLRPEERLADSLEQLEGLPIRYTLGTHREEEFRRADLVVKNPAVPRRSPYLAAARRIETDISIFLSGHPGPVYAITGTKGKSTTATALHHILTGAHPDARLGGNITVSPLEFADSLTGTEPIVLELSSFQLGDLLLTGTVAERGFPRFNVSVITNILRDHQDYYGSMDAYARDKRLVFRAQQAGGWVVLSNDDGYSRSFAPPFPDRVARLTAGELTQQTDAGFRAGAGIARIRHHRHADTVELVPAAVPLIGAHQRTDVLFAAVAATLTGIGTDEVRARVQSFAGIPHRLELVRSVGGVDFYNDSAATIAEATLAALDGFDRPIHLIAGGSDKGLPVDPFAEIARAAATVHLLEGTASRRIADLLRRSDLPFTGPHGSLDGALRSARAAASPGEVVILSPGCASFGMFRNEFDRGDQFRELVRIIPAP